MGRVLHIARDALIHALGGYTKEEVRGSVRAAIGIIKQAGLVRRERCIRGVEILQRRGAIPLPASPLQIADKARTQCLLAEIAGPTIGAQLDIERKCIQGNDEMQELQGKEQVLDLVSQDCAE